METIEIDTALTPKQNVSRYMRKYCEHPKVLQLSDDDFDFSPAMPFKGEGTNTTVLLACKDGSQFTGELSFQYNRLDLSIFEFFDCFIEADQEDYLQVVRELIVAKCRLIGSEITVELDLQETNNYEMVFKMKAKEGSLLYFGESQARFRIAY